MEPTEFIRSLQFSDSFFPVGAFAYSDGLETAAAGGRVRDADSLLEWMNHFVDGVFVPCEGLAVFKCMLALEAADLETVDRLDEELTAIRPAAAGRAASTGIGKRVLSIYECLVDGRDEKRQSGPGPLPLGEGGAAARREPDRAKPKERRRVRVPRLLYANAPIAYAVVLFRSGLAAREATLLYGYNRLAGIVSAGLRLIPIGQQQAQILLTNTLDRLPPAVDRIFEMTNEPLRSFNPLLDIEQMNHQYIYSRLFRS